MRICFTGDVTFEWQFARQTPARVAGALVKFQAGLKNLLSYSRCAVVYAAGAASRRRSRLS